ncbi:hypothetical protein AQUCO_01100425v1 [Aquilegia coerulea]|uniref:Glycoside hydrolase family 5 domain-containing protein n=1 Tax=Aquilegia coerulea TaxID=218851 RepID=A0A2G5E788_AQUCA|nr:hypothetical protein AQUCO_01100425v1 [Aquilegia coerulea]
MQYDTLTTKGTKPSSSRKTITYDMKISHFSSVLFLLFCSNVVLHEFVAIVGAMPLYANSRWIVNGEGKRVKLACVNWPSHLETLLAQGLDKKPVTEIAKTIVLNGFNCVRFTWPVALATNDSLASTLVENHFRSLGLNGAIAGLRANNPIFLRLPIIRAFQIIVKILGNNNVMVILDNHLSKPGWCCQQTDGNGFFGDEYFDPELWLRGLTNMATMFKDTKNVVGMSLRNELRGPNANIDIWHKFMHEGAEAVHSANPKVLVILSGLEFDNNLDFLRQQPIEVSFTGKLVFEVHRYASSMGNAWEIGNPNVVCGNFMNNLMGSAGFLLEQGFPLFLSEFGGDQRGINVNDNRFLNCMFGVIADLDLDWALWALQGSYYLRQGIVDMEEVFGVLNKDWSGIRNSSFMQKLHAIQPPFQGPGCQEMSPYNIMFHPSSGLCVQKKSIRHPVELGPCSKSNAWIYSQQARTIMLKGTYSCLQAVGVGQPVKLGVDCTCSTSKWEIISDSRMHLSTKLPDGEIVCLDHSGSNGVIVTNPCKCISGEINCEPASQWFKVITSTRRIVL